MKVFNWVVLPILALVNIYFVFDGPIDGWAAFNAFAAGWVAMGIYSGILQDVA